jgi:hypothetical protein
MGVVGVAVDRLSIHILDSDRREGHDVHLPVASDRRNTRGRHAFKRNQVWMIDGGVRLDGLQTEHLSETVGDAYGSFSHRMTRAATRLSGRRDLYTIKAIFAADGRRGRIVEEVSRRCDVIRGGNYSNPVGYCIHGGCFEDL